jgi:hypothetical protein
VAERTGLESERRKAKIANNHAILQSARWLARRRSSRLIPCDPCLSSDLVAVRLQQQSTTVRRCGTLKTDFKFNQP